MILETEKESFLVFVLKNIVIFLSVVSLLMLMLVQLTWSYDIDHTIFAVVGEVIRNGGIPYKDAWEVKGPAVYYIFAIVNWVFDNQEYGIRIFDLIFFLLGSFLFYKICKKISDSFTAIILLSIFGSFYFQNNWIAAEPDGWASILVLLIIYILLCDNGNYRNRNVFYIGLIIAFITCLKPPFVLYSLLVPIYVFLWGNKNNVEKIYFIVKTALVSVIFLFAVYVYLWVNDALLDFLNIVFLYNIEYHRNFLGITVNRDIILGLNKMFIFKNFIAVYPLFLIGLFLSFSIDKKITILLVSSLFIAVSIIIIQNSYLDYHYLLVVPPVLFIASSVIYNCRNKISIYLVFLLIIYLSYYEKYPKYFFNAYKLYTKEISKSEYRQKVILRSDKALLAVAKYIKRRNKERRPVFVFGFEQGINLFSESPIATKFIYNMVFIESYGEYFDRMSELLLEDLSKSKPEYIVLTPMTGFVSIRNRNKEEAIDRIKGLKLFIDTNYSTDNIIYPFYIYKRLSNKVY